MRTSPVASAVTPSAMTIVRHKPSPMSHVHPSLNEVIFKMRFTAKTIARHAGKSQHEKVLAEKHAKDAVAVDDAESARVHTENAARAGGEVDSYIKLKAQLERVAGRLQECQDSGHLDVDVARLVVSLDHALESKDVKAIEQLMQRFLEREQGALQTAQ